MGSVKDLDVIRPATTEQEGRGIFTFSDRFSVFDWGEMPDHIPNKGAALCMMTGWNFEGLERLGVPTHYLYLVDLPCGKPTPPEALGEPSNKMIVSLSRVVKPEFRDGAFSYDFFIDGRGKENNFVVPLEVIYRSGAPKGSSLLQKFADLQKVGDYATLQKLLNKYGLREAPKAGDLFLRTGYDFTTKFETTDRPVSDEDAYQISGLTPEQFNQLCAIRASAVELVKERAHEVGLVDFDGKHEYRLLNGKVAIADVFGTLDENRFMLNGKQVSKEFLRQVYKKQQPEWYDAIQNGKKMAAECGTPDWKQFVKVQPRPLDSRLVALVGEMYASASDRYTGLDLFRVRLLEKVMEDLTPYYPD